MCSLTESSTSAGCALAKTAVCGNVIVLARPLSELLAHAKHHTMPSFMLIARVIKTLALSIFKWHLCDYVLLPADHLFCDNVRDRISLVSENIHEENYLSTKKYSYLIESALFLSLKPIQRFPGISHDVIHDPFHERYKEVSVASLVEYYHNFEKIDLVPKKKAATIRKLMLSEAFNINNYDEMKKLLK